jgi:hypothetical protein
LISPRYKTGKEQHHVQAGHHEEHRHVADRQRPAGEDAEPDQRLAGAGLDPQEDDEQRGRRAQQPDDPAGTPAPGASVDQDRQRGGDADRAGQVHRARAAAAEPGVRDETDRGEQGHDAFLDRGQRHADDGRVGQGFMF